MKHAALIVLLGALGCTADGLVPAVCDNDDACPFEQCCVRGACIDPGPVGSCATAATASSTVVATPSTIVAGTNAEVRITLRDVHGRPIAGALTEILVQSSCDDCDALTSPTWATDGNGVVNATFTSTGAGAKTLTLRIGSELAEPVTITVVPDIAVSVGFATAIADTRVDRALADVAITRLDAFGNPDALPPPPVADTVVEIQLDTNPAGMVLVDAGRVPLPGSARRFVLSQQRVPIGGLYADLVAHRLRLTAFDATPVPLLAASQSSAFDVISPHLTSDMPAVLELTAGPELTLTWSMAPSGNAAVVEGTSNVRAITSPFAFRPSFVSETPNLAHLRIEADVASPARDVEVTRLGASRTFTPSSRAGSQVNVQDLRVFPDGDVLVVGNFNFDVRLGQRDGGNVVVTGVLASGLEGFLARFDPTLEEVRWVTLFYGIDGTGRPFNAAIRDSDLASNGDIVALAEFSGGAAAWRNVELPVTGGASGGGGQPSGANGAPPPPTQCVVGTPTTDTAIVTTVARLATATGAVTWCTGIHDPEPTAPDATHIRAGAVASISTTSYVAVRATKPFKVYKGNAISTGTPLTVTHEAAALGTLVSFDASPNEALCTNGVAVMTPIRNGVLDAAWPVIATGISFDPQGLVLDTDKQGFILGGNGCSSSGAGSTIEAGGTAQVTTARTDGMLLRVDTPTAHNQVAGKTMHLVWNSSGTSTDRLYDVQPYGSDFIVLGDFTTDLPTGTGVLTTPTTALIDVYAARINRVSHEAVWGRAFKSPTAAVINNAMSVAGNRIVVAAQSSDGVQLDDTVHRAIDMNDEQSDPVGLLVELDPDANVLWSSPFSGTSRTSRPLALPNGVTVFGANGLQGAVILGPLDATPVRQTNQRGGRGEPVVGVFTPWDYVVRDVLRK